MRSNLLVAAVLVSSVALADEGMWTLNGFPADQVKQRYGFQVTPDFLTQVQGSAVRIAGGCSASLVSSSGLVMTNHHCAHSCIEHLSTGKRDYVANGFYAKSSAEEQKCADMEVNQLQQITDVTARITAATKGLEGAAFHKAQRAEMAKTEKECTTSDKIRCDVVTLYHGGKYNLYKYRRFQDIRLVFAPEFPIAFFGGDPDNFEFPRYDLDVSFLRLYDDNKPVETPTYYRWSPAGAKEGELTFVTGNPGATDRLLTLAELEFQRNYAIPSRLLMLQEYRGLLNEYRTRGAEQARHAQATTFGVENAEKALRGREATLLDETFWKTKVSAEQALRGKVNADAKLKAADGAAWDGIAAVMPKRKELLPAFTMLEQHASIRVDTLEIARALLRLSDELPKPNGERLREYTDSNLPVVKAKLFSTAPIFNEFEIEKLTFLLTKVREELGAQNPSVKKMLGTDSPREVAIRLVKGTKLKDLAARKQVFDGGKQAIENSKDTMIVFAKLMDADERAIRKRWEDEVEAVLKKNDELVARARFALEGDKSYPDATLSLRVSFGQVKGYTQYGGQSVAPFTTFGGAFDHATGSAPFALPKTWLSAKSKLDLAAPLDMVTTNDIIGGNSGSPVINKDAQIVGLVFDGNIQSLGGDFWYEPGTNRTVAVTSTALVQALDKVYGAKRVLDEIQPRGASGAGQQ